MEKADGAFRTIREVADWLGVPTHVLRFWESKFDAVAPVKGSGGRRYYRPDDMRLLGGIKVLLHDQGQTIRGVAQTMEDEGYAGIMALSPEFDLPDGTARRTRRVIRAHHERPATPDAVPDTDMPAHDVVPPAHEDAVGEGPSDPGEPSVQPGPVSVGAPPAPEPAAPASVPGDEPSEDAQPVDAFHADPGDTRGDGGAAPTAAPSDEAATVPPSFAALCMVRAAAVRRDDPRRLRRVVRRLRGLADEVEEDLRG